eukprot:CAMPEP_0206046980 /NCGR_PEP_ID=MMETSP1466-20131121/20038_1 /ASSEMBLY_ACC=CAM_ASM_001126 /TAXON_ID=44452 /ORGANISM="Pavlova gyrans, Strain CCMP608" /LENGTH=204 /DNA_ID=CAMNT_0053421983 /DNA_START=6 /DNA_END=620 /DNA_ORIENTATION=+
MAATTTLARRREAYVWEDMVTGKRYMVNNRNGDHVTCNRFGSTLPVCRTGVSGVADTKMRFLDYKTKGEVLLESLRGPEPLRPPRLDEELRDERVATRGRYRLNPVSESELWMKEMRIQRQLFPERFEAERQADLKFRRKVEEAHKNFRFLERQLGPKAGGLGGYAAQPPKRVTLKDLEPYMNMNEKDVIPTRGNMDLYGLYRP